MTNPPHIVHMTPFSITVLSSQKLKINAVYYRITHNDMTDQHNVVIEFRTQYSIVSKTNATHDKPNTHSTHDTVFKNHSQFSKSKN